jgi:hypothetical protein
MKRSFFDFGSFVGGCWSIFGRIYFEGVAGRGKTQKEKKGMDEAPTAGS